MYKSAKEFQGSFYDFNSSLGFKIDPKNRWVQQARTIPWSKFEKKYAALFPSKKGKIAKPFRVALGSLIIQRHFKCSDKELVSLIKESPYLQYFIGCPGYEYKSPFAPSLLVEFRKRLKDDIFKDLNLDKKESRSKSKSSVKSSSKSKESKKK